MCVFIFGTVIFIGGDWMLVLISYKGIVSQIAFVYVYKRKQRELCLDFLC